ncbi:MAG: hypothetical protein ABIK09_18310 [Pseudomonadota bacterium]
MWGRKSAGEARAVAGEEVVCDKMANCFGVTSKGMAQIRGNGCLCLGSEQLVFVQWIPRRKLEIPRSMVLNVEQVKSHLGATKGVPLVKVTFTNAAGEEDSVAWVVRDHNRWMNELSAIVAGT